MGNPAATTAVEELHVVDIDDVRWAGFVATTRTSLFQSRRWCRLVADYYGFSARVLAVFRGEEIIGGLPFAVIDDFRGLRHVSFPFSDYCEPLGQVPWDRYEQHIVSSTVPWTIRGRIAPGSSGHGAPAGLAFVLPLPTTMAEAERGFHQKQRVNAKRLERVGASCVKLGDRSV